MAQTSTLDIDAFKRRILTPKNLAELGITAEAVPSILAQDALKFDFLRDGKNVTIRPDGISINESVFGDFQGPSAAELGWIAYLMIGAPLVEERSDIIQPPADVLSSRSYENRAAGAVRAFEDSIDFSISNTFSWHLEGSLDFTLSEGVGSEESSTLDQSLEVTLAALLSQTLIAHNHKDNIGTEAQTHAEASVSDTAGTKTSGTSTGSHTLSTDLHVSLMGALEGSITTSWSSSSRVSGNISPNTRVRTMATQRRQLQQYTYELPITFGGFVALHYPEPVPVQYKPPQANRPEKDTVIAQNILNLHLVSSEGYRPKGVAETISALEVSHVIFADEALPNQDQPYTRPRRHYL